MGEPLRLKIRVFDPKADYSIFARRLPHWSQVGTIAFITWRTWDSIPEKVVAIWLAQRDDWLRKEGMDPASKNWRAKLQTLSTAKIHEFQRLLSDRWNEHLDECHGACVLRQTEIRSIIADSFEHFDGDRYDLTDYVIMPNHVHLLAAFPSEEAMLRQCESWKHFTATKINRALNRTGRFWQQEEFDHLVRSAEHFIHFRRYIAENPSRAKLKPHHFTHFSKPV